MSFILIELVSFYLVRLFKLPLYIWWHRHHVAMCFAFWTDGKGSKTDLINEDIINTPDLYTWVSRLNGVLLYLTTRRHFIVSGDKCSLVYCGSSLLLLQKSVLKAKNSVISKEQLRSFYTYFCPIEICESRPVFLWMLNTFCSNNVEKEN